MMWNVLFLINAFASAANIYMYTIPEGGPLNLAAGVFSGLVAISCLIR